MKWKGPCVGVWRTLKFGLLLCMVSAPLCAAGLDLPFVRTGIRLSTSKPDYWRYEMVDFQVDAPGGSLNPGAVPLLEVDIYKSGQRVKGLPGQEACLLRWDANLQAWRGSWPIPWNPELGTYEGRLAVPAAAGRGEGHVFFSGPGLTRSLRVAPGRWLTACTFTLRGRAQAPLPPGFSVMTLEPGHSYAFPAPNGFGRGPLNVFAWARFMAADAFWHCALQTAVWPGQASADLPWGRGDLNAMRAYAAAAPGQGVAYGAYMLTFLVSGDFTRAGYEFTLSYNAHRDCLEPIRFISMQDTRRQKEIAAALRMLSRTPGVAYIGLDYVRSNTGGLEFTDEFLNDFDLEIPQELREAPVQQRRLWLGRHLVNDKDRRLHELWDWWRAHRVAQVLKGILDSAKVTQPVWVFSLGWKEGHQHGQDPRMLIDAGVGINAPMFYEADQEQFPILLNDWRRYLSGAGGALVVGQCVDSKLLHPRSGFNGPEELFQRQVETLGLLGPLVDRLGFFWHDLNRAMRGGRGAEGMREWALAGAASFARLREAAGVVPVNLSVEVVAGGPEIKGVVRLRNIGRTALANVRVAGVWTPGLGDFHPATWRVHGLLPGAERELAFTVAVTPRFVSERFRASDLSERMLAFRAQVLGDPSWPRPDVAFTYFKASQP